MNLQSGFVLAVVIGAVLLANRLGGTEEIARRLFQVVLGASLAFAVAAGTVAFLEPEPITQTGATIRGYDTGNEADYLNLQDFSDRTVVSNGVRYAIGVLAVLFGLGGMVRLTTIPLGLLLGGVLLVLSGGGGNELFAFSQLYAAGSQSSQTVDYAFFGGAAAGFAVLLWYGYQQWEQPVSNGDADAADDE